jgi:predicted transcriptional regulator
MSRGDPTTLGGLARLAMLSRVWKHGPPVGDDAARAFYFLRPRVPMSAALLSRAAIGALTRPVPPDGCSWCTARLLSATSFGAWEPPTDDDLYRAFLGSKCRRCRLAFEAAEVADRERQHTADLVAAGLTPAAAGRVRSPEQVRAQVAAVRRVEQAQPTRRGPAPTGVIWPAGQGRRRR